MKRTLIIIAATLFVVTSIQAGIDDDLIGYYPYDGDASDLSGNASDGTVYGATLTSDRFGNPDSAYHFDGNDHIRAPLTLLGPTDPRTFAGWFKFDTTSVEQHFLTTNGVAGHQTVAIYGAPAKMVAVAQDSSDECCPAYTEPRIPFTDTTTWNHVALTWDGINLHLYLNGVLKASTPTESALYPFQNSQYPNPPDLLVVGVRPTDFGGYFLRGDADDIRVYSKALSPTEVNLLYLDATDEDGDGFYGQVDDCNDNDAAINPAAFEIPGNVTDENCDGDIGACDPCLNWKNHGQYVRCVSHAIEDLVSGGYMTEEEGDVIVSSGAQSDIGKKGFVPAECAVP